MPRLIHKAPKYSKHKASGQAVVTLDGRDFYLGPHGSKVSKAEYDRLTSEWLANGRRLAPADDLRVSELILAFWKHAQTYYTSTGHGGELGSFKLALGHVRRLYGHTPAVEFGPKALKAVRQSMVTADWCRSYVNRQIGRVRQVFAWAVAEEMVPVGVVAALREVEPLTARRSGVRESKPVKPVPEAHVEAAKEKLAPVIRAMIDLQSVTGMRPGEVCQMRTGDIDTTGAVWTYSPAHHKTEHHGHVRTVYLGKRGQAIVGPYLRPDLTAFIFSPSESEAWHRGRRTAARKTPMSCGNRAGTNVKRRPGRKPSDRFTVDSYRRSIAYACEAAFGMPDELRDAQGDDAAVKKEKAAKRSAWRDDHVWSPNQLRHNFATEIRKTHGLEAAQVLLGHKTLGVTQVYAEKDVAAAMKIMSEVG